MAMIAFIYLWMAGVFVAFWLRLADFPEEERQAVRCVAVCVLLLAIRVAYSLIFIITGNMKFNAVKGNPTAYLCMTMLPEVGIIAVCTWSIMNIQPLPRSEKKKDKKQQSRLGSEESQPNIPLVQ
jgi:hypothetical protein